MTAQAAPPHVKERTLAICAGHDIRDGALLPILQEVQAEFGFVPKESIPVIATALNLSRADVHGVVTFYHDFRDHPPGRHVLKLCRAEACQSVGGEHLATRTRETLGLDWGETSADGATTLEPVYCLGLCSVAPAAMLDGRLHGRLDDDRLAELLAEART